jgi:enoyl-CoA hydratase
VYAKWGLTPVWGLTLRLPHRIGTAKASEMMLTSRFYTGREAQAMHLANFCFPDASFDAELAAICTDVLANSWYANMVIKRALIETDGLTLRDAYALDMFKNEGLAPDAVKRVTKFCQKKQKSKE